MRCNYDYDELSVPIFYKNMFRFADYVFDKKYDFQILWNNKDIKIGGKQIMYKNWLKRNICFICIQDLYNEEGDWLTCKQFCAKFDLQNCYLEYMGLIDCLKKKTPRKYIIPDNKLNS